MKTQQFIARLRALDVKIWANGEDLCFSAAPGIMTDGLRSELVQRKTELLAWLHDAVPNGQAQASPLVRISRDSLLPLSFAQQRLWFLDQLTPNNAFYNIPVALRLQGVLDRAALQRCLNELVERHEALRTTFPSTDDGDPIQLIHAAHPVAMPLVELSGLAEKQRETQVRKRAAEEAQLPFHLARGPLLRTTLLHVNQNEHILLLTLHHIVADGWSVGVLNRELSTLYAAFSRGEPSPLSPLAIHYVDYATWQRAWLNGDVLARQVAYWRKQLASATTLSLPTDHPRPAVQSFQGAAEIKLVPNSLSQALAALGQREGATLFMTLLTAFKVLLNRYSHQNDIVVGTPIANRNRTEIEGLIGFFVNTLVLRTDLSGDCTFCELLRRVRDVTMDAYAHQDLPFEKLVQELDPQRNLNHNPLFQVMFALQNAPMRPLELPGLSIGFLDGGVHTARFDLEVHAWESGQGLVISFIYSSALFSPQTIRRMMSHFETLLAAIVANTHERISRLPLLSESQRRRMLVQWNDTRTSYARDRCVQELFEQQVHETPDGIAAMLGNQELTYRELNARSNQLAHYLRAREIMPDGLVGICIPPSPDMLVAVLGVLKAGGAYVPLDPKYPERRLEYILQDSRATLTLTQRGVVHRLPSGGPPRVCLDGDWPLIAAHSTVNPACASEPRNVAYVIYTSGSTGRPKGVAMPHQPLVNLISWQVAASCCQPRSRTLQFASLSFDVSFQELFATWCAGGTLVMIEEALRHDFAGMMDLIVQQAVQRLFLPFVALQEFANIAQDRPDVRDQLEEVITAGEPLQSTPQIVEFFARRPHCRLRNQYGPTEAHVVTEYALSESPPTWPTLPPIGRPIANSQIYILDKHLQPVPTGVPGDLYIGGDCLTRGYHLRPEWTAERFVPDPFSAIPSARLYKTGDLAAWGDDGQIKFLGRSDHQVKLRGFRIELGEVETVLGEDPLVASTVAVVREDRPGDKQLVAYLVPRNGHVVDVVSLRERLSRQAPGYMIPTAYVVLNELPRTPSGKIDRRALPPPSTDRPDCERKYTAPRTEVETELARIWSEVLDRERVGVHDNFFQLGGHSLLAVRLFAQIEKRFRKKLDLSVLFQGATVAELARIVEARDASDVPRSIVNIQTQGSKPPLFLLHGLAGTALTWRALVQHFSPDQPIYGFEPPRDNGQPQPLESIHDMAARYVADLLQFAANGPYHLAGYSFGGWVAFEMACQLADMGKPVSLLAMVDTGPGRAGPGRLARTLRDAPSIVQNIPYWVWDNVLRSPSKKLRARLRREARTIWKRLRWRHQAGGALLRQELEDVVDTDTDQLPDTLRVVMQAHMEAINQYRPRRYSGRVTLFRARTRPLFHALDEDLGWNDLAAGGVEVIKIPGNHDSILQEPHVARLAKQLQACLDSVG